MSCLKPENSKDFLLKPGEDSCWITVDKYSVYILRTNTGVRVDIYDIDNEMADPISTASAYT